MTRYRIVPIVWAIALALVLAALGLQIQYSESRIQCRDDGLLALCSGPIDAWVAPLTLLIGGVLVALGLWRMLTISDGADTPS